MPTLGAHFSDDEAATVKNAARISDEKQVGPYIAAAVRQRLSRDGMLPGNPHAELIAAAEEAGIDASLAAVRALHSSRKRRKRVA